MGFLRVQVMSFWILWFFDDRPRSFGPDQVPDVFDEPSCLG